MESAQAAPSANGDNRLQAEDRAAHDWYRFVLSYPPHLVRDYLERFELDASHTVLDPFCGTGTTLVECKKMGIGSVGLEPNPMACFASRVKTSWDVDPAALLAHAREVASAARDELRASGVGDGERLPLFDTGSAPAGGPLRALPEESRKLLISHSMHPMQIHRTLVLLDQIAQQHAPRYRDHERLALAKALVTAISNLHFGPEVGVRIRKKLAPVVDSWFGCVEAMAADLEDLRGAGGGAEAIVHQADARRVGELLPAASIDAVITSPPYPNEKDYTRTTRLESVFLGFMSSRDDLRAFKRQLLRSNTRNVYKSDDDDRWVADFPEIQRIARQIEERRLELGKTSGFERMYNRVAKLYFGGMARHFAQLRRVLKPGALLAYVVGDQASYLQVMIRTGRILAHIAESLGYERVGIDLFRKRLATATRQWLREEVVILRWPGNR